jgi:hypothetical protein
MKKKIALSLFLFGATFGVMQAAFAIGVPWWPACGASCVTQPSTGQCVSCCDGYCEAAAELKCTSCCVYQSNGVPGDECKATP